ncbi:unnamed protein product, partial [Nesidiocoris tenuis]
KKKLASSAGGSKKARSKSVPSRPAGAPAWKTCRASAARSHSAQRRRKSAASASTFVHVHSMSIHVRQIFACACCSASSVFRRLPSGKCVVETFCASKTATPWSAQLPEDIGQRGATWLNVPDSPG